jgi:hypothetical protein
VGAGLVALAALAALARRGGARALGLALLAGAAAQVGFVRLYGVPDPSPYLIPPILVALLVLPLGAAAAARRVPSAVLALALALPPVALGPGRVGAALAERTTLERVEARLRGLWRGLTFERGIVLWDDAHYARLRAWQVLDGEKPGVVVENTSMLTWEPVRRRFIARTGIDPLAGLTLRSPADLAQVPANVRRQSALPVVDLGAFER